jgi:hypothetical protein
MDEEMNITEQNTYYKRILQSEFWFSITELLLPLLIVLLITSSRIMADVYYLSNSGSDDQDGQSPEKAWLSLNRVNMEPLKPNDVVLFKRGGTWRGQLIPHSGDETGHVTYGAYGTGEKPLLLGSVSANQPTDWQQEQENIWTTTAVFSIDVGNIICNEGESVGIKIWSQDGLKQQGDYWYNRESGQVKMYSRENPAAHYKRIELALNQHIINQSGKSYITYEDLTLRYGAAHGIGGGNTHHTIVRRCDISYIGGGHQFTTAEGHPVRFGNGIEFWANAHDHLVEKCRLWEIYDAALTNQNNGQNVKQYNITYRQNLIWNSEYSFEYWNRPENSLTHHIYFDNNTCVNAGFGWGHNQRPDPSGRHLCFYTSPASAHDIYLRNNIFFEAKGNAFYAPAWPADAINMLHMDHNCWYQSSGTMILLQSQNFAMDQFTSYQTTLNKEMHSIANIPLLVDISKNDFHLTNLSPCIDAGVNIDLKTDIEETTIPQGSAPDIGACEISQQ